jgi:hypothetical protein
VSLSAGPACALSIAAVVACLPACNDDSHTEKAHASDANTATDSGAAGCSRERVSSLVGDYFAALAAHDPSTLPLADDVRFTENATAIPVGEGLWTTAGALDFRRDLVDEERCAVVTQAVVEEGGKQIIFALRMHVEGKAIDEIETIVVRGQGADAIWFSPQVIASTPQPEWEELVPKAERSTREELVGLADRYFDLFVDGDLASYPFTDDCNRYEDGLLTTVAGGCPAFITAGGTIGSRRFPVADPERGVVAGIAIAEGVFLDLHMFKVTSGKVARIQAVMTSQIAGAMDTGWN